MNSMPLALQARFFDPLAEGRIDDAVSIFAEDAVFKFPGVSEMKGRRAVRRLLGMIANRFASIRWQVKHESRADPNVLIAHWAVSGQFKTGKPYENEGVSVLELNPAGQVRSFVDFFHSTDFSDG